MGARQALLRQLLNIYTRLLTLQALSYWLRPRQCHASFWPDRLFHYCLVLTTTLWKLQPYGFTPLLPGPGGISRPIPEKNAEVEFLVRCAKCFCQTHRRKEGAPCFLNWKKPLKFISNMSVIRKQEARQKVTRKSSNNLVF